MVAPGAWGRELLSLRLAQPDQRSCGAAVLVVAEALANEHYARRLIVGGQRGFAEEVLAMHRRATGSVDAAGRAQVPWPRVVGTPPWAVARQLTVRTGVPHAVRPVWPWRRRRRWRELGDALRAGRPVPVYVGSRTLPRHLLLAVAPQPGQTPVPRGDDQVTVYDPASGRQRRLPAEEFLSGRIATGWPRPWFTVLPRDRPPRPPGRRTPA